mmetsp:Transcript_126360/g.315909  ORF Transcript_126360/g.315909 Transcript_126360/m.315909 type:complete len:265 (+) Transcript_126360:180-974(+)
MNRSRTHRLGSSFPATPASAASLFPSKALKTSSSSLTGCPSTSNRKQWATSSRVSAGDPPSTCCTRTPRPGWESRTCATACPHRSSMTRGVLLNTSPAQSIILASSSEPNIAGCTATSTSAPSRKTRMDNSSAPPLPPPPSPPPPPPSMPAEADPAMSFDLLRPVFPRPVLPRPALLRPAPRRPAPVPQARPPARLCERFRPPLRLAVELLLARNQSANAHSKSMLQVMGRPPMLSNTSPEQSRPSETPVGIIRCTRKARGIWP